MTEVRRNFWGWCEDTLRAMGRWSLVVPKWFDRMADWCGEQAR